MTDQERKANISDEEYLARIKKLFPDETEAKEILEYDRLVERDSSKQLEYDLTPEQNKIAQKFAKAGTRKAPTVYKFTKKERKPNATKGGIITELAEFFQKNSSFDVKNFQIPNKEGKISFKVGEKWYSIALTEHRTKPNWCAED